MNFRANLIFFKIRHFILSKNGAKLQRSIQSSKKNVMSDNIRDKKAVFSDKMTK